MGAWRDGARDGSRAVGEAVSHRRAAPRRLIVVAGALAQGSGRGGHCWVFGQWFLGLRRLGFDVFFVDYESPDAPLAPEDRRRLAQTLERFEMSDSYALLTPTGSSAGWSRAETLDVARRSELLVNVMGFVRDEELLAAAQRRVFLDIDPGYGQMWRELGLADVLAGHDDFVTIGENVGTEACDVPAAGVRWHTTRQPVVLTHWPRTRGGTAWTTVASWRGPWGPIEYRGHTYGSRVHEFRKFVDVASRVQARCELALDIHADEVRDLNLLREHGWSLVDPAAVAGTPDDYRRYVQASRAELCVAKAMYVHTRGGWFSDRSACYLASGKPVLAQDTGFGATLPTGEGLIAFSTPDEAVAGVEEIEGSYERHARAARELAEEYFDSGRVLGELLAKLEVA
jgi:hypothetical protein